MSRIIGGKKVLPRKQANLSEEEYGLAADIYCQMMTYDYPDAKSHPGLDELARQSIEASLVFHEQVEMMEIKREVKANASTARTTRKR